MDVPGRGFIPEKGREKGVGAHFPQEMGSDPFKRFQRGLNRMLIRT